MKFKKNMKKGFTLVELIVVIAIVAILAAVSVVSYIAFINSANESADIQLVKQLNTCLQADEALHGKKDWTSDYSGLRQLLESNGFIVENLTKTKSGCDMVYQGKIDDDHIINRYALLNGDKVIYSETTFAASNNHRNLWIPDTLREAEDLAAAGKGVVLGEELGDIDTFNAKGSVIVDGANVNHINYSNNDESQTVVIRTNGGKLTVNAPLDTVKHYGGAESANIVKVASASYHEFGTVPFIQISQGRIEIEPTGDVNGIHVANVQTVAEDGTITKTPNTFSNDVVLTLNGKDVKLTRDTIGTNITNPVLVCEVQANANSDEYIWLVGDGTIENGKVYITQTNEAPDTSVESTTTTENASAAALAIANNAINTGTEEAPVYVAVEAGTSAENAQVVSALKGTGTEADPFLVYDYATMQYITTISSLYINDYDIVNYYYNLKIDGNWACDTWQDAINMAKENGYSLSHLNNSPFYFKVKDGTKIIDCNEDNQLWVSVKLYGNFDGNGVTFTNLDSPLFSKVYSQSSTIGNFTADCNIVSQTGRAAICTNSAFNTLFHDITVTGYIEGQGQTAAVVSYPGSGVTEFKNVNVSADIVSLGDAGAAAFVINPYKLLSDYGGDSNSKLIFDDCHYSGKMSATGTCKFFYVHTTTVPVEIKNIDSNEFGGAVNTYNRYALSEQSSVISIVDIDINEVAAGDNFVFDKLDASAVTCTVTIGISPNGTDETGSFTGVYLKDSNIELGDDGKFHTTNAVKITSASVNDNNKVAGLNDLDSNGKFEHYNIISSSYGTTHNGGFVTVIQYDSRGNVVAYASATLFDANN